MKKYIGNVGYLDIREATKEAVETIAGVENVGIILYSPETKDLLTSINCANVGNAYELDKDAKIINGNLEFSHDALATAEKPMSYLVNGKIVFGRDVTPEDVERGINKLYVNGAILCAESCTAAVRVHLANINGELVPDSGDNQIVMGKFVLDENTLKNMEKPVRYLVLGPVKMLDLFDAKLLDKVLALKVYGPVKLRQRYAAALGERLQAPFDTTTIVPDDATLLTDDLELDAAALRRFHKARLWTNNRLRFAHDITPELLKEHIAFLRCTGQLICRAELKETLFELSENEPNIMAYTHELAIVDGSQHLTAAELKFRGKSFALVNNGALTVDEDVDAQVLFDKLEFVINNGSIKCCGDACGALQARLRSGGGKITDMQLQVGTLRLQEKLKSNGEISDANAAPEPEQKEYLVKNAGYYKL